ncbi:amino acid adenylation domain-containing protein [Bacillus badius]|uniref:non-ribosomal peptide synthetase family protein n=1 Tax=Bacillus badius TaxID=1455 RepID=UPI001CBBEAC7|nr:non-ribosomal peptide synthetase [Bacillus badius]UAT30208.1 amino acid adenylation domain-containing protein [Bacillus badius]
MAQTMLSSQFTSKDYWEKELTSPLPPLHLPVDKQKHAASEADFQTLTVQLKACSVQEVFDALEQKQASFRPFFISAYLLLLHRLTNEEEIMLGIAADQESVVPIRAGFTDCRTVMDVLKQVNQKMRDAAAHSRFNWKELLTKEEGTGYSTTFSFGNQPGAEPSDLAFQLFTDGTGLSLVIEYNAALFLPETIARFSAYFEQIVAYMTRADHLEVPFHAIPIITAEEQEMYKRLNETAASFQETAAIHHLVSEAAERFPNQMAVSSHGHSITYAELEQRSNQVAHMLLDKGLAKEELVPIFMKRSIGTIISILGVLKAGGAYVPLDPDHPVERNSYIIKDTHSQRALVDSAYMDAFRKLVPQDKAYCIFSERDSAKYPCSPVDQQVTADQLAYVIYTSGSTGRPKGTLIRHKGVINLINWSTKEMGFTHKDVLCQFAPYSFDASIYDTFSALFNGARLYLLSDEERMSVEAFAEAVEREEVTSIAILPTIFFNELVAKLSEEGVRKFKNIRQITVGGEALIMETAFAFRKKFGRHIDIYNMYGPTECTVMATFYKVNEGMLATPTVPIGHPLDNHAVYVVNEADQLCPIGVPGELLISSAGVARGYLNQPDKTKSAFIPNLFHDRFSSVLYRSGDVVRLLPSGEIEYVSRKDSQIKIRGHRIEIGEVEDALTSHEQVKDAAVIPKVDEEGLNVLAAFYTSVAGEELSSLEVRNFLLEKLPKYMVPAYIQYVEEMPVSPSGKIDRRTLAAYELIKQEHPVVKNLPRTETESVIAEAWKTSLKLPAVDIYDNFFEIGGHSLKILETLVLLKPAYPQLKINDFFMYPTVAELAARALELSAAAANTEKTAAVHEVIDLPEKPIKIGNKEPEHLLAAHHILLTGATGYLGSHILEQLLRQTKADVYCLVRGESSEQAKSRLWNVLAHYFGTEIEMEAGQRVKVIVGDLEKEDLGLSKDDQHLIEKQIDSIIHCGADVRHFGETDHFSKVNKQSTESLLKFAEKRKGLRFHYISTLGIPEDLALEGKWDAMASMEDWLNASLTNVYVNSKLESEKLLFKAAVDANIPVTIYRAGNLTCHSQTGRFQKNIDSNAYYRMLKTMLALKAAPKVDWHVDYTPIDYASESIVALALQEESAGRVLHICNQVQIHYSDMIKHLRTCGYDIKLKEPEAYEKWLFGDPDIDHEILQLTIAQLEGDGAKDSPYRYTCPETKQLLRKTNVSCPKIDEEFFAKMISYATEIGYFPQP